MNDLEIDLCPELNENGMWEVTISDKETGDADSIHQFSSEEKANAFIDAWVESSGLLF